MPTHRVHPKKVNLRALKCVGCIKKYRLAFGAEKCHMCFMSMRVKNVIYCRTATKNIFALRFNITRLITYKIKLQIAERIQINNNKDIIFNYLSKQC